MCYAAPGEPPHDNSPAFAEFLVFDFVCAGFLGFGFWLAGFLVSARRVFDFWFLVFGFGLGFRV